MPLDQLTLLAHLTVFHPRTTLEIHQFTAISKKSPIEFHIAKSDQPEKPFDPAAVLRKIETLVNKIVTWQDRLKVGKILVTVDQFQMFPLEGPTLNAAANLEKTCVGACEINFNVEVKDFSKLFSHIGLKGVSDLSKYNSAENFLDGIITLTGEEINSIIPLKVSHGEGKFILASDAKFQYKIKNKWLKVDPKIRATAAANVIDVSLVTSVTGIPGPLASLPEVRMTYHLPMENGDKWLSNRGDIAINTKVPMFFISKDVRTVIERECQCKINQTLNVDLDAGIWIESLLNTDKKETRDPAIDAKLSIEDIKNKIFSLYLKANAKIYNSKGEWIIEPVLDTTANVTSFQALRKILEANKIMVPAPFSVLDGEIDFEAKGPLKFESLDGKESSMNALAKVKTRLRSANQRAILNAELLLSMQQDFSALDIQVHALIDDLWVELPPVNPIQGLPRVMRDSRIQLEPKVTKKKPRFKITFGWDIETTNPGAIRLLTPLADPYIPISIRFKRGPKSGEGNFLKVERFQITYLRRTVNVRSVMLDLDETPKNDFPIDARMSVKQTDYRVNIRIAGTIQSPKLELSSQPYLEYGDIISVLLYDRTRDELAGGDAETSGNVQAAMADRAIGLFGLWAFAATPIRSFSYNAVTKVYSATILLGDGLTAGIGTGKDEATSFEIRKRLSRRWVIAATWSPADEDEDGGEVVLQWEKRF